MLKPDPGLVAPLARYRTIEDLPNLTLLTLQFPSWRWNDGQYVDGERRRLVQEYLSGPGAGQFEQPVQWFYDPMTAPAFLGQMGEVLTVYDCMDELSRFREAPPEIISREAELISRADVVFTGGRKLCEAKRKLHPNCHFYGCGVDGEHFGKARAVKTRVSPELAAMRRPVLGYFGVVDERLDYDLLSQLADAQPDWSIVMIGPAIKVEADSLPRRKNLHWLGQRAYSELPCFCKGFDLCLMPFALNEATEFINPTKALEYMATGHQIVSTAVPDVVSNFSSVIRVAQSPEEFVDLCRMALQKPDKPRIQRGLEMVNANSWEKIVSALEGHIEQALERNGAAALRERLTATHSMKHTETGSAGRSRSQEISA
ncbi:MAG: glycosyltransferase family 1 protein [Verrucomicrobia bacterium]|nr:MAG: glycosyltransferase family 1 protein [Verrucomicrobiota bacterium]